MKDLEQIKNKYSNIHESLLGLKQPEGFSKESKALIREKLNASTHKKNPVIRLRNSMGIGAVAASLLFLIALNHNPSPPPQESATLVEDVFVTSLLLDTLLLEEEAIDQVIQESLLDNFEQNLALN